MRACMNGSAHHFQLAVGLEVEELQPKRTGKRHPLPEGGQLGPVSSCGYCWPARSEAGFTWSTSA